MRPDVPPLLAPAAPGSQFGEGPLPAVHPDLSASSPHPVINASGTFDAIAARRVYGDELLERFPFSAFVSKTITLEPRSVTSPSGSGRRLRG